MSIERPARPSGVFGVLSTAVFLVSIAESLDHEVRDSGIRVVLVEPAYTRTAFESNVLTADQKNEQSKSFSELSRAGSNRSPSSSPKYSSQTASACDGRVRRVICRVIIVLLMGR